MYNCTMRTFFRNLDYVVLICVVGLSLLSYLFMEDTIVWVKNNINLSKDLFWGFATAWSLFLAFYAFVIHANSTVSYGSLYLVKRIQQFTLNFLGVFAGFVIVYFVTFTNVVSTLEGWERVSLLVLSFVSLTGYLPYLILKIEAKIVNPISGSAN